MCVVRNLIIDNRVVYGGMSLSLSLSLSLCVYLRVYMRVCLFPLQLELL